MRTLAVILPGNNHAYFDLALGEPKYIPDNIRAAYAILNSIPDLLFHLDKNGTFLGFYQENITDLAVEPRVFIGKNVRDVFDAKQADMFLDAIQQTLANGVYEHEYELHVGRLQYYSAKYSRLNENEVISLVRNITGIKQNEHKIRYLLDQQKLLANVSQLLNQAIEIDVILPEVLRLLGVHTGVSRVYIFEDTHKGTVTSNTFEWCNEGIVPQIGELQQFPYELIPSWKKIIRAEGRIFSKNIRELPQDIIQILEPQGIKSILIYPLHVEKEFFGFIGFDECKVNKVWPDEETELLKTVSNIISNAFERRNVIRKLEESELRLKLAVNIAKEGLWDWNYETGYVYYDDFWCEMLGYQSKEIEPHFSSWQRLVHPDDLPGAMAQLEKHLKGEAEDYEAIHRLRTKDGNWKWILARGAVIQRNTANQPLRTVGFNIDISDQKAAEQQLKESIDTQQKLFSIIAHDLRGPIANFIEVLELLTSGEITDEKIKDRFLEELKKSSWTTFILLENLLNWSRSQTHTLEIDPQIHRIRKMILENKALIDAQAHQKSIALQIESDDQLEVFCDRHSINLVIRNLLTNAIKFTPDHGLVRIHAKDAGRHVEVEVTDNGVGIPEEVVEKLFNSPSFYSTFGTNNEKGSGLGLALCKDFVERNGGSIRAESKIGTGSRFVFTIPKH